jgi:NADH-quinone oxidoreductase subunit D
LWCLELYGKNWNLVSKETGHQRLSEIRCVFRRISLKEFENLFEINFMDRTIMWDLYLLSKQFLTVTGYALQELITMYVSHNLIVLTRFWFYSSCWKSGDTYDRFCVRNAEFGKLGIIRQALAACKKCRRKFHAEVLTITFKRRCLH